MNEGTEHTRRPGEAEARVVLERITGLPVVWIARFPTGLAHYVYDACIEDGRLYVVRLTTPAQRNDFAGAVYWHSRLAPRGVPLPALLHVDLAGELADFPALVLERLPGTDLDAVYPALTERELRRLAGEIVAIQRLAASLPLGPGYGFARSYADPALYPTWSDLLDARLARSRRWIRVAGVVDEALIDRLTVAFDAGRPYFATIEPRCFLDDLTTKNVIVDRGRLCGIVDVDWVCFGDPLLTPALTRMALLSRGYDPSYVAYWLELLDLSPAQSAAMTLYTALFAATFLGELGQAFNRALAPEVDQDRLQHLLAILDGLLSEAERQRPSFT
ncbi:MAG TPA: aminoglycoside phosphotransferase family protein [Thermomicrobiaceae bacterium]|nr:aminoglycoside phosphotransferase family protein [Thermomicrobiaceae bacterium]